MVRNKATDATLTEYLSADDNHDPEIDGPAKIINVQNPMGVWKTDDGEQLDEDPDEYRVECSCGEVFSIWGKATRHVEEDH